ncbi:uncharacterized protein LOC125236115 [Leguminivora glycinivorella]|uniref:uncharacterized protein LOC125236115 n=1 Tax=Leguminivora glycinivorella TaxID=1035111 RepID=UPI00200C193E|nr:uncharacterized protein LOC125236115 [Leguminivora glycinivorella]
MVKKHLKKQIIEFKGISERIAVLNIDLQGHKNLWTVIQIYAPTEGAPEAKKDEFYRQLSSTLETAHENIIVMGDFNGKIGIKSKTNNKTQTSTNRENAVIGKFSTGERNDNGKRLIDLAFTYNLKVMNTFFKKKHSRKWTWISPNGQIRNEIDYILTNKPIFIKDVDTVNQLNFNTNHRMIRGKLYMKQPKASRKHIMRATNSRPIHLPLPKDLLTSLHTNLKTFKMEDTVQNKYDTLERELKAISSKVNNSKIHKDKVGDEARALMEIRRNLITNRGENRKKIADLSKQINTKIRKHMERTRLQAIQYHIEKTGGTKKALKELRDKTEWIPNLKDITTANKVFSRPMIIDTETGFYQNLYNDTDVTNDLLEYKEDDEEIPNILESEVRHAILTQKTGKAPGDDKISNEIIKGCIDEILGTTTGLFNDILKEEVIPEQWKTSTIILLHKKGDKSLVNNYRPISLITNMYKIFSKVILNRISKELEANQPKEQAGFRSGFSTVDHIHTIKQIIEKHLEYNKIFYLAFIDYNKAFDSLKHKYIWEALQEQNIQTKYIRILQLIYQNSTAKIRTERDGKVFSVKKGVKQGDPLSPKLFSAVLEYVFRKLNWESLGIDINGAKLSNLRFADDIILLSDNPQDLNIMLQQLADVSKEVGLTMNTEKTKIMTNSGKEEILIDNNLIEYVEQYTYLGQVISPQNLMQQEVDTRIGNSWKRYWSLREIMKNNQIPTNLKSKVFNTCILPCLTYGCQTWALTDKERRALQVCQNSMERSMLHIKLKDRIKLDTIRKRTKITDVNQTMKQLKWKWTGHMLRDKREKWSKDITSWYPRDGKRKDGGQKMRWENEFRKVAGALWRRQALDRETWRNMGEAYAKGNQTKRLRRKASSKQ